MKILFVVPYVPTLIRPRPYNFVRGLAQRGHQVDLVTLWQRKHEHEALTSLRAEGVSVIAEPLTRAQTLRNGLRAMFSDRPLQSDYCWHEPLLQRAQAKVQHTNGSGRYDLIHVEHLRGVRYALALKGMAPTVWDSVDCISYLFEQASRRSVSRVARGMARFELERTRRYERWLIDQFERVLVTSEADKQAFAQLARRNGTGAPHADDPCSHMTVLPNAVDLEYFRPTESPRKADTLVLSGKMSYHANVTAALHFVNEILPLIWKERPQTKLWIVGQAPPASIRSLASDSRIFVTGYVSDLRPYIGQAVVAVCPLVYGAGVQNKVLEAMACATPVVCRPLALNALDATAGEEVLVGDSAESFAQQVLALLRDPHLATRVGDAGRRYVERQHSWPSILQQLEETYREAIGLWNSRQPLSLQAR